MSAYTLEQTINNYQNLIAILTNNSSLTEAQILNILIARDHIQTELNKITLISDTILAKIQQLDKILENNKALIAPSLAKLRPTFNPDSKNWWWLLEVPKPSSIWQRWDGLCNGLSISFLTISLGLVGEISSRFLSGGPDTFGAILISVQSVLTLLTAGGALTKTGQEAGQRFLRKFNVPEELWQEIGVGLSGLLMLSLWGFRLGLLPIIATNYSNLGWHQYEQGNLSSAEKDYKRALSLNLDDAEAHFRLGLLYEDLQNFDSARTEYLLAMQGGNQPAINNLARLYILAKNDAAAVSLITNTRSKFTKQNQAFEPDIEYALLKNLGWARLNQKDYNEAKTQLNEAMELLSKTTSKNQKRADIYCLLAQVKEQQSENATKDWDKCNAKANPLYPEEDKWRQQAQKHLVKIQNKKPTKDE